VIPDFSIPKIISEGLIRNQSISGKISKTGLDWMIVIDEIYME